MELNYFLEDQNPNPSYTSLGGFDEGEEEEEDEGEGGDQKVNPDLAAKIELQAKINDIVVDLLKANSQLFIRPCKLDPDDTSMLSFQKLLNIYA